MVRISVLLSDVDISLFATEQRNRGGVDQYLRMLRSLMVFGFIVLLE
jgi:hypothetical protein